MASRLIAVPFHDGLAEVDRGLGPAALLAASGRTAAAAVDPPDPSAPEAERVFAVARELAGLVREARAGGALPIVLAGDCNSCLGTVADCEPAEGLGVVWFDAHADSDTPEDSVSGALDAMGLALLAGHGWAALRAGVPGLAPISERDIVLAGVRDLEPGQRERLGRSAMRVLAGAGWPEAELAGALDDLHRRVKRVYLHVDLDALDPGVGIANRYSAPGGMSLEQLLAAIAAVAARFELAAAAITAYDPAADAAARMAAAAARLLAALVG